MNTSDVSCSHADNSADGKTVEPSPKLMDDQVKESMVVMENEYPIFLRHIRDKYKSLDELFSAIREVGLESSNVIIGIDYTKSNETQGKISFNNQSLHFISDNYKELNPYQRVIRCMSQSLSQYHEDEIIPLYAFGDIKSKDKTILPILYRDTECKNFDEVLQAYREITPRMRLSGPTNFAPLIDEAVKIVQQRQQYHILLIIADGQVTVPDETIRAIVEASEWPLSIIMVGVGDGPWEGMKEYDDGLSARKFDNFQFVNYTDIMANMDNEDPDAAFALHALMEIPDQFKEIKKLGLLNWKNKKTN